MIEFKKSICQILYQNKIIGTGFFVGNGRVITAAHVVENCSQVQACFIEANNATYVYKCDLPQNQPNTDICILMIDEKQNDFQIKKLKLTMRLAAVNSTFISYGYPGENQGNMSFISGKILNTHDGCVDSEYTADLEVTEGKLNNYEGFSGAPVIVNSEVVGICTYQCSNQLRMVEFCKNEDDLIKALKLKIDKEKPYISNVLENKNNNYFISRKYLQNEIAGCVCNKGFSQIIVIRGCSGIGKTTWLEQLENTRELCILGKYYVNKSEDSLPTVYRKSEEALYDWFCMLGKQFSDERLEVVQSNNYVERLNSVRRIFGQLDSYLESINKQGLICIDGLDEFANDDMKIFELFCSYFSVYSGKRTHIILTVNSEKILPSSVLDKISEDNIIDMQFIDAILIREYFLKELQIENIDIYVDQLVEKTEGHPLYLRYIIESVKHMAKDEDMASFIEEFPTYGGDIRKYYAYKWKEIKKNENSIKLVAYLARARIMMEKETLLQMVSITERIAFEVALDNMNGLLIQDNKLGFFHSSFQRYVCDQTKYIEEEIHHVMAAYCLGQPDTEYGVTQLLYHLSRGNRDDRRQCIISCNQKWMDKCGEMTGGPEVMLHDMQMVLGICCDLGEFAQLIDKLLLMQRAQVRYDEMFARFAGELAIVEIERDRPEKALEYLYRCHTCLVCDEDLLICLERMISKEQWDCANEVVYRMETEIMKFINGEKAVSVGKICAMLRAYQIVAFVGGEYYYKKLQLLQKIVFSQELDEQTASTIMQACSDYNLWKNGVIATAEKLKERGLPINKAVYNNWILSVIGAADLEAITEQKSKSWEPALQEIQKLDEEYTCDDHVMENFIDVCMSRREYSALLRRENIAKFSGKENDSLRKENGVDIDFNKFQNMYIWNRNHAFLAGNEQECVNLDGDIWKNNWEEGLNQFVRCVGSYYGLGLSRVNKNDVDKFKRILENNLFSFDERTEFENGYHIPETVMEYLMPKIAMYFIHLYPDEKKWFLNFVQKKADDQFGVYNESYFRIMFHIIRTFQQYEAGDEVIVLLKKVYSDIISKVANRYERTGLLLNIVKHFIRSGCDELAEKAYEEMLKGSMGPLWYKEAQYSLIEQAIKNMDPEDINEDVVRLSMAILDAASGGMTFERYIRTSKESLIEELWKKGKYWFAIQCMKVQLVPEDWQAEIMSNYEQTDQKNHTVGNYRVANCIFPQRMIVSILEDSTIPDDFRWAFSEIFLLVERRNFHSYIGIQADILANSGKRKKKYYDRIVNILVCDAGEYYFEDLLKMYQMYLSEDEFQVIIELLGEYVGKVELKQIATDYLEEDIIDQNMSYKESEHKEELLLPGTFGERTAIKKAEEIWQEAEKEERKGNIKQVKSKCLDIINIEETGGWPIWNHGADKYAKSSLEKIIEFCDNTQEFMCLLKNFIMTPKYSARWQMVETLLDLSMNLLDKEEKMRCYNAIIGHYKEMMNVPERLSERYRGLKDEDMMASEACYALLLDFMVYPHHYISQKSIELYSWIMGNNDELMPLLIKYCQSENLEIAEICSSYCLKLSNRYNRVLMKTLEKTQDLTKMIIQNPWQIVRGNLYLVVKRYKERSGKLRECCESVLDIILKEHTCKLGVESNEMKKLIAINDKYHCMEPGQFQFLCGIAMMEYKFLDETGQRKFEQYIERICAGFHDNILKQIMWRNKLYHYMNTLEYDVSDERSLCEVLNVLRRVNWSFPLPEACNTHEKKYFFDVKKLLLENNSRYLNRIFSSRKKVLTYQGVVLNRDNVETVSIRTFLAAKRMTEEEIIEEIFDKTAERLVTDYPLESSGIQLSNLKEISIPWYPGSLIGFNIAERVLNQAVLAEAGISSNAVKEGIFIGEREWEKEQTGRPAFYLAYGSVEDSEIQCQNDQRLIAYMEYYYNSIAKRILVDFDTHNISFL